MSKFNVLIIGCGQKGALADAPGTGNEHKYLSYAHAVTDHHEFELCGFTDIDAPKVEYAERTWSCEPKIPDVWIIASPDNTHFGVLKEASEHYPLLVICEKPLCTDLNQAHEIVDLYKSKGIPLLVDYTRRFIPEWQKHKKAIDDKQYGKLLTAYGRFNDSFTGLDADERRKAAWLHTGSHMVDTALWMCGDTKHLPFFDFHYIPSHYKWFYQWAFCFEKSHVGEMMGDFTRDKVSTIYDRHLWYVMDNAYEFLEGRSPLICRGEDALRTLEKTYEMMERG